MEVTAKGLRGRIGELLACVERGESVVITYRGRPRARLVAIDRTPQSSSTSEKPGFGMWRDRADMDDVDGYVRDLRRPRNAG